MNVGRGTPTWAMVFAVGAAGISIIAGLYLLASESASDAPTVFDSLMHGIGGYFVARGCWMVARLGLHTEKGDRA